MNLLHIFLAAWTSTNPLPDPQLTPGAVADTNVQTVCSKTYDLQHRPDAKTSRELKIQALDLYHILRSEIHNYESDALVPVSIGGDHFKISNVWPQKCDKWAGFRCVAGDAYLKDLKETRARKNVCKFLISNPNAAQQLLIQYQHQFMTDWREIK